MSNVWDVAPRTRSGVGGDGGHGGDGEPHEGVAEAMAAAVEPVEAVADEEPTPLGLEAPEPTGDAVVDRAVGRLTQVDVLATELHGEVYEDVHRELREVLTGLDR